MLKITVEIIPLGMADYKRRIAEATVTNDGTGDENVANYIGEFMNCGMPYSPDQEFSIAAKGIERKKRPVWEFLYEILKAHYEKAL